MSAYYYSDEIRGLVDTFGEEEIICEDTTNFSQVIENAKSTLAYMSMLTEGARTVLADGIDDINNIASATGGEPAKESKFGFSMPSFGDALSSANQVVSNAPAEQESQAQMQTADNSGNMIAVNERINGLEGQIASLTETVANLSKLLLTSGVTVQNAEPSAKSVEEPSIPVVENEVSDKDTADAIADLESLTADSFGTTSRASEQGTSMEEFSTVDVEHPVLEEAHEEVVDIETESEDAEIDIDELVEETTEEPVVEKSVVEEPVIEEPVKQVKPAVHSSKLPPIAPTIEDEPEESIEDDKVESVNSVKTSEAETKPKDGSDSLAAFLSNGVGFSVKF